MTASKSGYPNATATVNVAIGAVTGNMYEQNFVLGGSVPPSITTQPQGQSISQGANATFTVTADGTTPLSYQWRLYATNIAGATASSYTRNNVQPADAGPYSVVVTNVAGTVTSSNALLSVVTNVTPAGNRFPAPEPDGDCRPKRDLYRVRHRHCPAQLPMAV